MSMVRVAISFSLNYSLGQKFRTFKWDFFIASLQEICKLARLLQEGHGKVITQNVRNF